MWAEIFSLWLALWLRYSKITPAVPVKPPIYLKGTISWGVNNEDSLNLKWLDRPYFIGHGMTTQLGWRERGSYEDAVEMQQHKKTITCLEKSGFWRELSTYRKPPFAVFLLFTFSASSTSVHMQRQNQSLLLHCGDRESFHERRAALHTAQPSSCGCVCTVYFVLAQQSIVAVWCLAVSNKGRTFVSEHPE